MNNKLPMMVELEPGTYYWCSCGKTATEPFCDGSHTGTSFLPVEFVLNVKKKQGSAHASEPKRLPIVTVLMPGWINEFR